MINGFLETNKEILENVVQAKPCFSLNFKYVLVTATLTHTLSLATDMTTVKMMVWRRDRDPPLQTSSHSLHPSVSP